MPRFRKQGPGFLVVPGYGAIREGQIVEGEQFRPYVRQGVLVEVPLLVDLPPVREVLDSPAPRSMVEGPAPEREPLEYQRGRSALQERRGRR